MYKVSILLFTLLFVTACGTSGSKAVDSTASDEKLSLSSSQKKVLTATVEAVNHKTREVTLRGKDGKTVDIVVSEEARNLDQVSVGDVLNVEYVQSMVIEVATVDDAEAELGSDSAAISGRSEKGEMPGMAAVETTVIKAIVEELNFDAGTYKLKGADGKVSEFKARNPENLKKAAVGDLVVITYTKAMAITVEKPKAGE